MIFLDNGERMNDSAISEEVLAYHEAGHTVAACLVGLPFESVTIIQTGSYLGTCLIPLQKDFPGDYDGSQRELWVKRWMFMGAAGTIAEEQFTGRPSDSDHGVGVVRLAAYLFEDEDEVNHYAKFIWEQTKECIVAHWNLVQAVANALCEQKTVEYQKVCALLCEASPQHTFRKLVFYSLSSVPHLHVVDFLSRQSYVAIVAF
jgi:hypothetical protein